MGIESPERGSQPVLPISDVDVQGNGARETADGKDDTFVLIENSASEYIQVFDSPANEDTWVHIDNCEPDCIQIDDAYDGCSEATLVAQFPEESQSTLVVQSAESSQSTMAVQTPEPIMIDEETVADLLALLEDEDTYVDTQVDTSAHDAKEDCGYVLTAVDAAKEDCGYELNAVDAAKKGCGYELNAVDAAKGDCGYELNAVDAVENCGYELNAVDAVENCGYELNAVDAAKDCGYELNSADAVENCGYETPNDESDEEKVQEHHRLEAKIRLRMINYHDERQERHRLAAPKLQKEVDACQDRPTISVWDKATFATDGEVAAFVWEQAQAASMQNFYVGATVKIKRRWDGWIDDGPRGSCRGHQADWQQMKILAVRLAGSGPASETKLIKFVKRCRDLSHKVTNKSEDARGLPKTGVTFLYMCWNTASADYERYLEDQIE
jgi:hypothetical protein